MWCGKLKQQNIDFIVLSGVKNNNEIAISLLYLGQKKKPNCDSITCTQHNHNYIVIRRVQN